MYTMYVLLQLYFIFIMYKITIVIYLYFLAITVLHT